jgi:hypothetical protein
MRDTQEEVRMSELTWRRIWLCYEIKIISRDRYEQGEYIRVLLGKLTVS